MISVNQDQQQKTRPLPSWLAGLVVLLLLTGSAYALYRLVWQERKAAAVESVPVAPNGGRNFSFAPRGRNDMQPRNNSTSISRSLSGRIRAEHSGVVVRGIPKQPSGYDSILEYERANSWVTPAQWDTQILAGRPSQYPALAKQINLTEDQKQKIEALRYQPTLTAAEKDQFDKLFTAWQKAGQKEKEAAAEEVSRAVEAAGKAHLAEAQAALQKRCAEVTSILSADQMQQIRDWFNSAPKSRAGTAAAPASPPAPRPEIIRSETTTPAPTAVPQ